MPLTANEQNMINAIHTERKTDDLSNLSISLILAAQSNNAEQYETVKQEMWMLLDLDNQPEKQLSPHESWMLGRMVVSAYFIGKKDDAQKFGEVLAAKAPKGNATDALGVWANGYLLEYYARQDDKAAYNANKQTILGRANEITAKTDRAANASTIAWIHVVNMHAAAVAGDNETYNAIKQQFINDIKPQSSRNPNFGLVEALALVPDTDFPAWIHYWALRGETLMKQNTDALEKASAKVLQRQTNKMDCALGAVNRDYLQAQRVTNNPNP